MNTALTLFDTYSIAEIREAIRPFALSPVPHPHPNGPSKSLFEILFGVRTVPGLGVQTDSLQVALDRAIVGRSWGLFDSGRYYGDHFSFTEKLRARNTLIATLTHFAMVLAALSILLSPIRALLKKLVYQPGEGPEFK